MTNLNPESDNNTPSKVVNFVMEQRLQDLYTAMPGVIEEYDVHTRRARVLPAFPLVTTEGYIARVPVHNVPVLFPSGGGYTLTFPLKKGDAVLIVYSKVGLGNFKLNYGMSLPTPEGGFAEHDAIIIPGFSDLVIASQNQSHGNNGVVLQSNDGTHYIALEDGGIDILAEDITLTGSIQITGDVNITGELMVNGNSVGSQDTAPSLPSVSSQMGVIGRPLSVQLPATLTGNPPFTYTAISLPAGLVFTASSRHITGTPNTRQSTLVFYRVVDVDGDVDATTFNFNITSV